uniref:DoxX family protein n=1 Tax=Pedobacter schmidteae TaxID=2201271 RepID=UPI000EB241E6|nr:hypothetical protein [Pedobacter schmidteae]
MKPLVVLILTFCLSLGILWIVQGEMNYTLSARIALSIMFIFTAIGHFAFSKGMTLMLPDFVPFKKAIVYLTGILEILFAIGILIPAYQVPTGWTIIVFLILILPSNIYAAVRHLDIQKATFDGNGLAYLWFRIPMQLLLLTWTYFSTIGPIHL